MRGLKIIPLFLFLIILSYIGVIFVQNNPDEMVIHFFNRYETPPLALGFIILTSALVGMVVAGILCVLELVVLYLQNKSLKRKLEELGQKTNASFREMINDSMTSVPQADETTDSAIEVAAEQEEEEAHPLSLSDVPPPPAPAPASEADSDDNEEDVKRSEIEIKSPTGLN